MGSLFNHMRYNPAKQCTDTGRVTVNMPLQKVFEKAYSTVALSMLYPKNFCCSNINFCGPNTKVKVITQQYKTKGKYEKKIPDIDVKIHYKTAYHQTG